MIKSFKCKETKNIWNRKFSKRFAKDIQKRGLEQLIILNAAMELTDLRLPPSNHLEKLSHDRVGQHSIRINDQWRICFSWNEGNILDVEITDYH